MSARFPRAALAALLFVVILVPTDTGAQDSEIAFPPVGDGKWEGLVNFTGFVSTDNVGADGSFSTSITDVIDDTSILLDFTVDRNGEVTSGTMRVDLTWFVEIVGTTPVNFEPFRVVHDHHQVGTLQVTGNAQRLVASGTLTHTANTVADGDQVEEVSGTDERAVEWVFSAVETTCVRVTSELIEASGISLMGSTLIPRSSVGESDEIYNGLLTQLLAWPASVDDPDEIREGLENITNLANEVHDRDIPQANHLLELVAAWDELNAKLAQLNECQAAIVGWVPESASTWLVGVLYRALDKALENEDSYDAQELIDLWDTGWHERALDGDLVVRFLDAFHVKLNEAIAVDDTATITDILAFASAYGYPNLHAKALGALEG